MGHEQTETDALATLDPDELRDITLEAIEPFYNEEHEDRVAEAQEEWEEEAQEALEAHPKYAQALERLEKTLSGLKKIAGF
jgi:hypothetical protein